MLEIYQELEKVISRGERAVLATIVSSQGSTPRKAGAKMLIKEDGTFIGTVGGGGTEHQIRQRVDEVLRSGQPQMIHFDLSGKDRALKMVCGGQEDVFLEPIMSPETLYLFGAGHTAQSMAAMGKMLGFCVAVIDPRPDYNNSERFPNADTLVVEEWENAFSKLNVDENSYVIVHTMGSDIDEQCLEFVANTKAKYIGMIGSRRKATVVKEHLMEKGVSPSQLDRLHSPMGLVIGADTPEEIAISILAEIIKIKRTGKKEVTS